MVGEWQYFPLGELCSLITDGKHGDCENESESGYFFLSVKDVFDNRLVYENARQITEQDFLETHRRTNLEPGDILFTNTGTIGRMAIAPDDARTRCTTFQKSVAILKPRRNLVEAHFLYYTLKFDNAKLSELAAGTTQKNLLLKDFRSFQVRIPGLSEQRAIAHILSTLDDKIELNRRMNETLEAMARALFKSWFVDFDPVRAKAEGRDPGLPKSLADLFPDSFEDSALGEIPKGWRLGRLDEVTGFLGGYAFKSKDWIEQGVPVVKIGSVKPGIVDLSAVSYVSEKVAEEARRFRLVSGDLLIGMTGYVGEVGLVPCTDNPPLLNQRVGKFLLEEPGTGALAFLYCLTRQPEFKAKVETKSHGTAQANVSAEGILSLQIVVPPKKLREEFNRICQPILDRILVNHAESANLAALRDTLLPKLISGEIRCPPTQIVSRTSRK